MLVMLGEFTRRCLAIVVARRLRSNDVLHCLADLFVTHGPTEHIRSDNGPEFVAINVREWLCNPAPSSNDKEDARIETPLVSGSSRLAPRCVLCMNRLLDGYS